MPSLELTVGTTTTITMRCLEGQSVRTALDATSHRVRSACSGIGACGLCRIRVLGGEVSPPSATECLQLDAEQLAAGERLACQTIARGDLRVEICASAPHSGWCRLSGDTLGTMDAAALKPFLSRPEAPDNPLAAAVDLGTTHLRLGMIDLATGVLLTDCWGDNPQSVYGSDVMTRLQAAVQSPQASREMQALVIDAIADGLLDMASRDGIDLRRIASLAVVGNTAMLALLAGQGHERRLVQPAHWEAPLDCVPGSLAEWRRRWELSPAAEIEIVQPLAGFVGSDLLCGLAACRLLERPAPTLYIDFGTNTEVALWDGARLWVTSASGGPAFEGGPRGTTLSAEPGAIHAVSRKGEGLAFDVIGNRPAKGLCGSGLVDLVACLRADGLVSARGTFQSDHEDGFTFVVGRRRFRIGPGDLDVLQRAKAAIGVAIASLCGHAGVSYQPKIALDTHRPCGAEALIRWRHPERGLVSPLDFIPVAEETGDIIAIGNWVLGEACRQIAAWQSEGALPLKIAVNVSATQFCEGELAGRLGDLMKAHAIDGAAIEIELTESTVMTDPERAIQVLKEIKALGVSVAVDDFGTGYSSLSYLKRLPIDVIKIDRSFITDVGSDADGAQFVTTIVTLGHSLGLSLVAEGIETTAQFGLLRDSRCEMGQGYLFGRPMPAAEFQLWLLSSSFNPPQ